LNKGTNNKAPRESNKNKGTEKVKTAICFHDISVEKTQEILNFRKGYYKNLIYKNNPLITKRQIHFVILFNERKINFNCHLNPSGVLVVKLV
jgi:hypothetical protein